MRIFRAVMFLVNAAAAIAFAVFGVLGYRNHQQDYWVPLMFMAGFAVNVLYIVLTPRDARKSRIGTLISLWFDVKERELRDRRDKTPEGV